MGCNLVLMDERITYLNLKWLHSGTLLHLSAFLFKAYDKTCQIVLKSALLSLFAMQIAFAYIIKFSLFPDLLQQKTLH